MASRSSGDAPRTSPARDASNAVSRLPMRYPCQASCGVQVAPASLVYISRLAPGPPTTAHPVVALANAVAPTPNPATSRAADPAATSAGAVAAGNGRQDNATSTVLVKPVATGQRHTIDLLDFHGTGVTRWSR